MIKSPYQDGFLYSSAHKKKKNSWSSHTNCLAALLRNESLRYETIQSMNSKLNLKWGHPLNQMNSTSSQWTIVQKNMEFIERIPIKKLATWCYKALVWQSSCKGRTNYRSIVFVDRLIMHLHEIDSTTQRGYSNSLPKIFF